MLLEFDMDGLRRWNRFTLRFATILLMIYVLYCDCEVAWGLNSEGLALLRFRERVRKDPYGALNSWQANDGESDPCSWFGVECSNGNVVILNLRDLCLQGTLTSELGRLTHIKSIILRNNSFTGAIPEEIGELRELEVLDLGYNNFTGPFPLSVGNNFSLTILLLDNNNQIVNLPPEINDLKMISESQVEENQLIGSASARCSDPPCIWDDMHSGEASQRRLLQLTESNSKAEENRFHKRNFRPVSSFSSPSPAPLSSPHGISPVAPPFASISVPPSTSPLNSPSPAPSETWTPLASPAVSPTPVSQHLQPPAVSLPHGPVQLPHHSILSPAPAPNQLLGSSNKSRSRMIYILSGTFGASFFIIIAAAGFAYCQRNKVVTVKPWTTGLSGQLQKAFVTGVPKLQRSELETACEDFSNIIGAFPSGTIYKGTLSSGVEIAVTFTPVKSAADWSENLEARFRKKIETLSKVNHKNFVNLIGYCEEEEPFTRMMVFEYAPSGTLFEHLHIKESEHLEWVVRLRIAMGMAYCLEYMHQLSPPIAHSNLVSSSIYLTEDYAAKLSDFSFWNEAMGPKIRSASTELLEIPSADPEANVLSFGLILFEMITGQIPCSVGDGSPADWVAICLRGEQPCPELVDATLKSYREEDLEKLFALVKQCVLPDPIERPTMKVVVEKLKEITGMDPDGATPKSSPLWWAELEILSTESS